MASTAPNSPSSAANPLSELSESAQNDYMIANALVISKRYQELRYQQLQQRRLDMGSPTPIRRALETSADLEQKNLESFGVITLTVAESNKIHALAAGFEQHVDVQIKSQLTAAEEMDMYGTGRDGVANSILPVNPLAYAVNNQKTAVAIPPVTLSLVPTVERDTAFSLNDPNTLGDTPTANTPMSAKTAALLQTINTHYLCVGNEYRDRTTPDKVAFIDNGDKLATKANDAKTIATMLDLAESKNWPALKLNGSQEFKQAAWLEANLRNIEVSGYSPSQKDIQLLVALQAQQPVLAAPTVTITPNTLEPTERVAPILSPETQKSLNDAKAIAVRSIGTAGAVLGTDTQSGKYQGKILGITDEHLVQQLSPRSVAVHTLANLPPVTFVPDKPVSINYAAGKGVIKDLATKAIHQTKSLGR